MTGFLQDLRYALRQLRKSPGFAVTAILIVAIGVCASVSIFGFVDAALIKPLPYEDPTRLVFVTESVSVMPRANLSYPDYLDWKRLNQVFQSLDVYHDSGYLLRTSAGTEPVPAVRVSDGFFRTLGITPLLGRDFYTGEDLPAAPMTVMLSFATWQKRFGGRKEVIGETVTLSGIPFVITGVLPESFQFAPRGNTEFWTTLHASNPCDIRRSCHSLDGIARLKEGVTAQMALANMKTIARQLELQYRLLVHIQAQLDEIQLATRRAAAAYPTRLPNLGHLLCKNPAFQATAKNTTKSHAAIHSGIPGIRNFCCGPVSGTNCESGVVNVAVQDGAVEVVAAAGAQVAAAPRLLDPFLNCTVPVSPAPLLVGLEISAVSVTLPPETTVVRFELNVAVVIALLTVSVLVVAEAGGL